MRNIVTMHQPNYLPWIGLFSKIAQSECFVIMDNFQYTKGGMIQRNKIRTNTGTGYLTIPISKDFWKTKIKDVEMPQDKKWKDVHWQSIYRNYVKTNYFQQNADFFKKLYQADFQYLSQFNIEIIRYLLKTFDINVEIITASSLDIDQDLQHTEMIMAVLDKLGAKTYLSGPSGRNYMELEKIQVNKDTLKFFRFDHPIYKQRYPGFEQNMSAIDLLFNMGPQSKQIIKSSGSIED